MQLKAYQQQALAALERYLAALQAARDAGAAEWDREAWRLIGRDPAGYTPHRDGCGARVPVVCLKAPTGGGKTLLAVKALDLINRRYRQAQTGLALWVVPTTQIYRQTLHALRDRSHPYRQLLDISSGGRTLVLDKATSFTPDDVAEQLVVLLLMLPSANRRNKETLRLFRDQGGFDAFFPAEDQWRQHAALLDRIPNLDAFDTPAFAGSRVVKSSLGNTLRLLAPLIVLDEGHRAYSPGAQQTLLGFNPAFVLELSATPPRASNILVAISGRDLLREGMIKLDMHLQVRSSADWRDTLRASHARRVALEASAERYAQNGGAYIRPICLVQVERTGAKQRDAGCIHAEDARAFLIERCGVAPAEIAVKSSERDEIEHLDLLDPACPIRYIITRQALQEGWDCPFAYVLAVLTNAAAGAGITQLVGRILRQPYARKTGLSDLDESYVFWRCEQTGAALAAVQAGLAQEGLDDVVERVVPAGALPARDAAPPRPARRPFAGQVYLACWLAPDGRGGLRKARYAVDLLSRVDWEQIELRDLADLELTPRAGSLRIGLGAPLAAPPAPVEARPLDMADIARQLTDIIPNPWVAHALAAAALERLGQRAAAAPPGGVVAGLRRLLHSERDRLVAAALRDLVAAGALHCCLVGPLAGSALPAGSDAALPPGAGPAAVVVLCSDRQAWALDWLRAAEQENPVVALLAPGALPRSSDQRPDPPALGRLCQAQSRPLPWSAVAGPGRTVAWQTLPAAEWQRIIEELRVAR